MILTLFKSFRFRGFQAILHFLLKKVQEIQPSGIKLGHVFPELAVGLILIPVLSSSAFGAAPTISSPSASNYSVKAGHLLRIPFVVSEPENNKVNYSVSNLSGPSMPGTANLYQIYQAGTWEFTWWPDSDEIGTHSFRFTAEDSTGLKSTKDIDVQVKSATGSPKVYVGEEIGGSGNFVYQDSPILFKSREGSTVSFRLDLAGTANNPLSFEINVADDLGRTIEFDQNNVPNRWTGAGPNTYWLEAFFRNTKDSERGDRGVYSGVIAARDLTTNQVTNIPITIDVEIRRPNDGSRPIPYAVMNFHDPSNKNPHWEVVSGVFPLDMDFRTKSGRGGSVQTANIDLVENTSIQYILYTAQPGSGATDSNEYIEISPILKNNYAYNWDTTTVPDGTYAMSVKYVDGPHIAVLKVRTPQVVVANQSNEPISGPQMIPATGFFYDGDIAFSDLPDFVSYSGTRRPSRIHPYPYRFIPPATTLSDPTVLIGDNSKWFVEALLHTNMGIYQGIPGFYTTTEGHVISEAFYAQESNTVEDSVKNQNHDRHAYWCLDRGRSTISPYSTFVPVPGNSPGWYGIDLSGRLFLLTHEGHVTTIAGYVTRDQDQIVPHDRMDTAVSLEDRRSRQARLVGDFNEDGEFRFFNKTTDLVIDPFNLDIFYIADAGNHRIAKVDFSNIPIGSGLNQLDPVITTYAGQYGVEGHQDGPGNQSLLNDPYSLAIDPNTGVMYVADRFNNAIRKIVPSSSSNGQPTVSTLAGGPSGPLVPDANDIYGKEPEQQNLREQLTNTKSISNASINYPQALRLDSNGNIIFLEDWTRSIRRVNFSNNKVERLGWLPDGHWGTWVWLDVDTKGVIGPKDDILVALSETLGKDHRTGESFHNTMVMRYDPEGVRPREIHAVPKGKGRGDPMQGWAPNVHEPGTHYPWAVAIDDVEARYIVMGFGSSGVYSLRMKEPSDPENYDSDRFRSGLAVHRTGTVSSFPFGIRPPLSIVYGRAGFNQFGDSVLNFDDIALLPANVNPKDPDGTNDPRSFKNNVDIANFIRAGMDGVVRRPEITGSDLADYIYFIRYNSLEGQINEIDPDEIAQDLHNAGLHDLNDNQYPEIRNINVIPLDGDSMRITWETDENAIGFVSCGPTVWYGINSSVESNFGKTHSVDIHGLISDGLTNGNFHYSIYARDIAGNTSTTKDATFTLQNGGTNPIAQFSALPPFGVAPLNVSFDASQSFDNGTIESYEWNFDDGTAGSGEQVAHTFQSPGTYVVQLTLTDNEGKSGIATKTIVATAPPDSSAPSVPTNVTPIPQSDSEITITWLEASDNESGISSYVIYRDGISIGTSDTTSYSDTGLQGNTTYTYQIAAVNGVGLESEKSFPPAQGTTLDSPPLPPSNLTASVNSATAISLAWIDNSTDETNFIIERSDGSSEDLVVSLVSHNSTNEAPTIEQAGSPNSFQVGAAQVNDRTSTWSEVPALLNGCTRLLTARSDKKDEGYNSMYIVNLNADATVYATVSPEYGDSPMEFMDPTWINTGLTVDSQGDAGAGTFKIWKKEFQEGDITLGADNSNNKQGVCYIFKPKAIWTEIGTVAANTTTYQDSGLAPESTYSYRVKSTNISGDSDYSNIATATTTGSSTNNNPPSVSAGPEQSIVLPNIASLAGNVNDDELPNPPGATTVTWSKSSGPGSVTFSSPNSVNTTASFSEAGIYLIRLTADDSELTSFDEVTITVQPDTSSPNELLAYYSFDENANDLSGSGNHGEIVGASLSSGVSGQAYEFDGTNDYMAIQQLKLDSPGILETVSVSAWIKTNYAGDSWFDNWSVVDFDRDRYFSFFVRGNDGHLGFSTTDINGTLHDFSGNRAVNDGKWHFICAVYNGSDKILYIDGVEDSRFANAHNGNSLGTGDTRYGFLADGSEADSFNGDRNGFYFEGSLDEIKIYSRSLADNEILQEFESMEMPDPNDDLWLSYSFEENVQDMSGNDNNGQAFGPIAVPGALGQGYEFDGVNDYVAIEKLNFNNQGAINALTICAWVKTTNQGGNWYDNWSILDFDRNEYFALFVRGDDGRICFSTTDSEGAIQDFASSSSVNDGKWHFISAVYNGTDKILYVDGVEDNRLANAHGGTALGSGTSLRYGFLGDGSEANEFNGDRNGYHFQGALDELKVYGRALSSIDINDSFNSVTPPDPNPNDRLLLSFSFEGDAVDGSGNGNDGEVFGEIQSTSGRSGMAYDFDGGDDYIAIKNLNFDTQGEINALTVCSWVNTMYEEGGAFDNWSILDFDRNEYFSFYVRGDSEGQLGFSTTDSEGNMGDFFGSRKINDGDWHFVCAVYDGMDKVLYVDGAEDSRLSNAHAGRSLGSGNNVRFGFIGDGSEADSFNGDRNFINFKGLLDELRLYSRALPAGEIETLFTSLQSQGLLTIRNNSTLNSSGSETSRLGYVENFGEPISWTTYEDAEDLLTKGWFAYNEGTVENITDGANGSERAIKTTGNIDFDVFRLGKDDGGDWNNDKELYANFSIAMEKANAGALYFQLETTAGVKYLVYTEGDPAQSHDPDISFIGLGDIADGSWYSISRNLQEDLSRVTSNTQIISVKNLFVYGSLILDDIRLLDFDPEVVGK